jgi:3'-phosphoadenosine 5'-phosphosulfate sulfotransferase (PAPS reductase)/FAD synthetase
MPPILTTPEIDTLLGNGAIVAIGTSGGKDSGALALALTKHLDKIEHPRKDRVLIHSDLGLIEWPESIQWCHKTAEKIKTPLIIAKRKAGDMIQRWETRWQRNWERYLKLECIKVILPWSTPAMRFCTSELKTDVICSALKKRFPTGVILSACGIRAEESPNRAKAPVARLQKKLRRKTHPGYDWNPILHWKIEDIWAIHKEMNFPPHPAYNGYGSSRVSCSLCIMSSENDKLAALRHPQNHPAFLRLCQLEAASAFGFQRTKWLLDLDPNLLEKLDPETASKNEAAKTIMREREALEATLPESALFLPGKTQPNQKISREEAEQIARVRSGVLNLYKVQNPPFCDPGEIQETINKRVENQKAQGLLAIP